MNKLIAGFIGICLCIELLALIFGGTTDSSWMLWAAGLVALRLAYLAGRLDRE